MAGSSEGITVTQPSNPCSRSSFMYVALADLIPQLQKRLSARETAAQIVWLLVGIGLVTWVSGLAHGH